MTKNNQIEVSGFETMADSMEFADNYNSWVLSKFLPYAGDTLLEIGTGQGNFKKYLQKNVKTYVSLDIDEKVIERAKLRDPNGHYEVADISDQSILALKNKYNFDSIICVNVLEHVPDHKAGLNNMINLLKPGGHLLLYVPSFMHLYNDLDKLAGHLRRYTKKDVENLIQDNPNCKIIVNEYFNPVGAFGWWINKFKKHKNINSKNVNNQVIFFDKFVVPFSKFFNPLFKQFWGQSLYCIIQKNK
ncbi:MAG: class I SAM-dependent methyltransferase [Sphingobacteriaceae bacterium]|nr:class I SAM-dependent methyltransferase [Sphingobacteriaceae bacterium]